MDGSYHMIFYYGSFKLKGNTSMHKMSEIEHFYLTKDGFYSERADAYVISPNRRT